MDEIIQKQPGIVDAAVCAVQTRSGVEEIWAGIVINKDVDIAGINKSLLENPQIRVGINELVVVDKIPRNELGKLQRFKLKELLMGIKSRQVSGVE
jgi:acyl-coenzyme A synthetase/AMP-(fatty) acid ligase